jgi:hypothetical protein
MPPSAPGKTRNAKNAKNAKHRHDWECQAPDPSEAKIPGVCCPLISRRSLYSIVNLGALGVLGVSQQT